MNISCRFCEQQNQNTPDRQLSGVLAALKRPVSQAAARASRSWGISARKNEIWGSTRMSREPRI